MSEAPAPRRRRFPYSTVIVLVGRVHSGVLDALAYAKALAPSRLVAVSIVSDEAFWDLDGPCLRITTPHIPLPAAGSLEDLAMPSAERIHTTIAASIRIKRAHIFAINLNFAAGDAAARARIDHGRKTDGRFAGTGFPDEADNFAARKLQGDIFDHPPSGERFHQMLRRKHACSLCLERCGAHFAARSSQRSTLCCRHCADSNGC